jgi:hypothetical protein
VKSTITDQESALIKGAHGYIQGYNGIRIGDRANQGIVAAEAYGRGSESEHFPQMLDKLEETMKRLRGAAAPLERALVEGDWGYCSENNLQAANQRGVAVVLQDQQFRKGDAQFAGRKGHGEKKRFRAEDFVYNKKKNSYTCPGKKTLTHQGHVELNRNSGET